jgi:hypothetical protein
MLAVVGTVALGFYYGYELGKDSKSPKTVARTTVSKKGPDVF